jgi:hypothetical protein
MCPNSDDGDIATKRTSSGRTAVFVTFCQRVNTSWSAAALPTAAITNPSGSSAATRVVFEALSLSSPGQ